MLFILFDDIHKRICNTCIVNENTRRSCLFLLLCFINYYIGDLPQMFVLRVQWKFFF